MTREEIAELIAEIGTAKTEPSPSCNESENHDYTSMHYDGTEVYGYIYKCKVCGDVFKKEYERQGIDKLLWSE